MLCKNCGRPIYKASIGFWKHSDHNLYGCEANKTGGNVIDAWGLTAEPASKTTGFQHLYDKLNGTKYAEN